MEYHAQEQQHFIHSEHVARTAVSSESKRKKVKTRQIVGIRRIGCLRTCCLAVEKATGIEFACFAPQSCVVLHNNRADYNVVSCELPMSWNVEQAMQQQKQTCGYRVAADFNVLHNATQLNAVGVQTQRFLWGSGEDELKQNRKRNTAECCESSP